MAELPDNWLAARVEEARALRERFSTCCRGLDGAALDGEALAAALATHLGSVRARDLPQAARHLWHERIARALKADPLQPLSPRAIAAIRSWPSARLAELRTALADIEAILVEAENDALNEAIYAEISRAYS
jgi:hypothetical protein